MSLLKRIQNLWKMSESKPHYEDRTVEVGDVISMIKKPAPQKMAEIIRRTPKDPIAEVVGPEQSPL